MNNINVIVADGNELTRLGLAEVLKSEPEFEVLCCVENIAELMKFCTDNKPVVVIMDYNSPGFTEDSIKDIKLKNVNVSIVGITFSCEQKAVRRAFDNGLCCHILKECDHQEISDSIKSAAEGETFYCGKVLNVLKSEEQRDSDPSCLPVSLSNRENEIIGLIGDGLTNKDIADKLFISAHTVMTHRKNIMAKLGVNNTAGIVIYAVQENLVSPDNFKFQTL